MIWEITGIDPRKRSRDKGRLLSDNVEADLMYEAIIKFCKRYPNVVQLSVLEYNEK